MQFMHAGSAPLVVVSFLTVESVLCLYFSLKYAADCVSICCVNGYLTERIDANWIKTTQAISSTHVTGVILHTNLSLAIII